MRRANGRRALFDQDVRHVGVVNRSRLERPYAADISIVPLRTPQQGGDVSFVNALYFATAESSCRSYPQNSTMLLALSGFGHDLAQRAILFQVGAHCERDGFRHQGRNGIPDLLILRHCPGTGLQRRDVLMLT